MPVSSYRYRPCQNNDGLRERVVVLAREKPCFGYRRLHVLLRRAGEPVDHKRAPVVSRSRADAEGEEEEAPRETECYAGRVHGGQPGVALDLAHDAVASGCTIRVLSVVDAYTRECLALEVDTSFAGLHVTRVLDQIFMERGQPRAIRFDNGPELTGRHFLPWAFDRKIDVCISSLASPRRTCTWRVSMAGWARSACR